MQTPDGHAHRRILVIDDTEAVHKDFRKILCPSAAQHGSMSLDKDAAALFGDPAPESPGVSAAEPFEVDSAFQGQEGLEKVQQAQTARRPYALAFVDGRMPPGWDGIETITHLWKADPELQIVICTAYADYTWEEIIRRVGQNDSLVILKKPFDTVEALQLAHAMTRKWSARQRAHAEVGQLNRLIEEQTLALRQTQKELVESAQQAGQAKTATGALHNVGNLLNSVNVTSEIVAVTIRNSRGAALAKVVEVMRDPSTELGQFLTRNEKGRQVTEYLAQLATHLHQERGHVTDELEQLSKNLDHLKQIIAVQQNSAKFAHPFEEHNITDLVEDSLQINASVFAHSRVKVVRDYNPVPLICTNRHSVIQILVNLISNARNAFEGSDRPENQLTLSVRQGEGCLAISIGDNGVGIPPHHLPQLFSYGFTTRKEGHGFGLHSAAQTAKDLGGSLHVRSDGAGQGATFTLELPSHKPPG